MEGFAENMFKKYWGGKITMQDVILDQRIKEKSKTTLKKYHMVQQMSSITIQMPVFLSDFGTLLHTLKFSYQKYKLGIKCYPFLYTVNIS